MASVVIEQLERYITMVEAQLKVVEESLAIAKSKKDASVMAIVKACMLTNRRFTQVQT
jgi:hypothetical protein